MAYQYRKAQDLEPTQTGAFDPYRAVFFKLLGNKQMNRPRAKTPVNLWRKSKNVEIEAEAQRIIESTWDPTSKKTKKEMAVSTRDKVARDMFEKLSEEEKLFWKQEVKDEHNAAVEQWAKEMNGPIATDPASRQRCVVQHKLFLRY